MRVTIVVFLLVLILITVFSLWYFRYALGIQKMPNDFALEEYPDSRVFYTEKQWSTYIRQEDRYFVQNGNYVSGEQKKEINRQDYIKAFRKFLKQNNYFGAQVVTKIGEQVI